VSVVRHPEMRRRIRLRHGADDIRELRQFLERRGALSFKPLRLGLFPAAGLDPKAAAASGYGNVWVRDNVYVALAHDEAGVTKPAVVVAEALAAFYVKYKSRFEAILDGGADPMSPMIRPHVRFDGATLQEIPGDWAHAQNDALGYFLWLYCRLAEAGKLTPNEELLALFVLYFEAIRYWEDEDSGHWEERRKVEASSIGAVVAGLRALRSLFGKGPLAGACRFRDRNIDADRVDALIAPGVQALKSILPAECIQPDPLYRRYDAALLFLCYPLDVVDDGMAQRIVHDVAENLQGEHGVRRYLGDSYWTADYKTKLPPDKLTADFSEDQRARDALHTLGEEAQWCIFDPIISVIFGRRYLTTGSAEDLDKQVHYLNRSLGQITGPDCAHGELRCPEAYYLENGRYVANDQTPLLWTQANLWLALSAMERSARR
jgi:hypothetical protein